jgi:hypothetical protein
MGWYRVTKKINGRLYDCWQRTERHGMYLGSGSTNDSDA